MYIPEILYTIGFLAAFRYFSFLQLKNNPLWVMPAAFLFKLIVGIVFLVIYLRPDPHNLVPSDTMRFLSESKQLHDVFYKSPAAYFQLLSGIGDDTELIRLYLNKTFLWDSGSMTIVNDSRNMIRLHSLIWFVSSGSPFVHTLFMCFLSLLGIRCIYTAFLPYVQVKPLLLFGALVILPSAAFWSSGILKEPLLLLGLGLLLYALMVQNTLSKRIFTGLIALAVLMSIKPYVLACLLVAIVFYLIYTYICKSRLILSLTVLFGGIVVCIFLFQRQSQRAVNYLSIKQFDFSHIGKGGLFVRQDTILYYFEPKEFKNLRIDRENEKVTLIHPSHSVHISELNKYPSRSVYLEAGQTWPMVYYVGGAMSYIKTTPINRSPVQLIKNIPEALSNAYFRPFPGDPGSALGIPAMMEVWGLSAFLIFAFVKRRKINAETRGIIVSLVLFSIFLLLIVGWTTPVIGAIFRYRFPAYMALLVTGFILLKGKTSDEDPESLISEKVS